MTVCAPAIRRNALREVSWDALGNASRSGMMPAFQVPDAYRETNVAAYPTLEEVVGVPVNKRAILPVIGMGHPGVTTPVPVTTGPPQ
ncbi:hypothetical protein GCM10007874_60570 [Labrys miyagiensis]|uniref:Uncharacterized protein n=1 Tax=Labrys miyagiensis TaxID=346912 RepID=A0ABQ6CXN9_9HYPH|nr:hypothetical protein GCM10007874_60570 [Labrys miyagiensis]